MSRTQHSHSRSPGKSKAKQHAVLANSDLSTLRQPLFLIDEQSRFLYVNDESCRMLGYSRDELLSMGVPDIDPDLSPEQWPDIWNEVKSKKWLHLERHHRARDGRIFPVEIDSNYFEYEGKGYSFAFARDITDRKQMEEDLRRSEMRYRMAQAVGHVGNWEYDIQTGRFWGSGEAKRIYGFDPEQADFSTDDVERCITDREQVRQALVALIEEGKPYDLEFEIHPRNSQEARTIASIAQLQRDEDGKPFKVIGVLQDITERKRNEAVNLSRLHLIQYAHTHSLEDLFEETLNEAEKLTGSCIGFYHTVLEDQRTLVLQNWSTRTKAEFCHATGKGLHYPIDEAGVWVDCVHEGRPVIHNDYASLPHRRGLPEGHADVVRELVVPVFRNHRIKAILGVGNKPTDYKDTDLKTVSLLADLAWETADRKKAEEALHRSNRELRAISECNQTLMRATDEAVLLHEICRIVCEVAGYRMAWVGYREDDDYKTIRPAAWGGIEEGYLSATQASWADTLMGQRPAGIAIRTGQTVYIQELATDKQADSWRELALRRGYQSSLALPLKDDHGTAFGVLVIYAAIPGAFTPDEVRLLEELAGDLAYGITALSTRAERLRAEEELLREVTERRRAEAALGESEERYRSYFEQNPAGNFISNPEGVILDCNPAFVRMFGFASQEEVRQMNSADFYAASADREKFVRELMEHGRLESYEEEFRRQDGSPLFATVSAIGTFNKCGKLIEIRGFLIDETERRKAEKQLRVAQKMEAVGRLSGGIAHDFNNSLGVILGYSELLLQRVVSSDPARHQMEQIRKAAQHAASLTRQLLAFSRQQVLEPRVLNLNTVVADMNKMLRRLIGEDIQMIISLCPDLGQVKADPGQIEQVLANLAVNARDAMPTGGKLTIETANVLLDDTYALQHEPIEPGPYVLLAVSDTGTGVSKEIQAHIFEPFFTTKEVGKGTGLGLATVYGIVKQSGGYIWVYSELGMGTTFKVYLPRVNSPVEAAEAHREVEPARGSETILLVEDSEPLRELTCDLLRALGYTVLEASDPIKAMQVVTQYDRSIHLLITDAVMPGMSGRKLAQQVVSQRKDIRVLYISGYTDDAIAQHGMLESGAVLLQKPFTREALAQKVRDVLGSEIRS